MRSHAAGHYKSMDDTLAALAAAAVGYQPPFLYRKTFDDVVIFGHRTYASAQ